MTRREAILQAAVELFAERGYDGTSTADIAERAGVAHGTVFHHFKTKENLLVEMGAVLVAAYRDHWRRFDHAAGTGWEALERSLRLDFAFIRAREREVVVLVREIPRLFGTEEERRQVAEIHAAMDEINGIRRAILRRGLADGSIRPVDPEAAVFVIQSLIEGVIHRLAKGFEEMPADAEEAVVGFFRRTLRAGG